MRVRCPRQQEGVPTVEQQGAGRYFASDGKAPLLKQRKRAVKQGNLTALTFRRRGAYFHRKVAGGSEPWGPRGPPIEACWPMLTQRGKS